MATITQADMQKADIIVSTGAAKVSSVIRAGTLSSYSHAALYIGGGEIVEAIGEGVVRQSLSDALRDDTLAVVYRRKSLTEAQAESIARFARAQVGKAYDHMGVIGSSAFTPGGFLGRVLFFPLGVVQNVGMISNFVAPEAKFFCSELVLMAFEKAGAAITFKPSTISAPGDIPGSHLVEYVGHLVG